VFSINVDVSPCRNTKGFDYEARSRRMSAPTWPSIFRERSIAPMTTGVGLRVAGASTRNSSQLEPRAYLILFHTSGMAGPPPDGVGCVYLSSSIVR
jgi:hypothetical protein